MSRPNPVILFGFLLAVLVAMVGPELAAGGLMIGRHEGDTLHLMQILFRMDMGQWPHKDFMTPIGILAFAPAELFLSRGAGVGHALIYGQALVGIALLPMLWWVGYSRLHGAAAYLFGAFALVLAVALVHGESFAAISMSMHYNRWAWALAYVAIALAILPSSGPKRPAIDGGLIGLCMVALVLLKVTYFVAFAGPVLLALIMHKAWRTLAWAAVAGLLLAALMTALGGMEFWWAYLGDLREVSHSDLRPRPGYPLLTVMTAPAYLGGTLVAFLGVVLLRQGGRRTAGLLLLVLLPAFFYVTYQNYGNDPQWLILLVVLLLAQRPRVDVVNGLGWHVRTALNMTAVAALAFALPSFFNLTYSPFRHLALDAEKYVPLVPNRPRTADLRIPKERAYRVNGQVAMDGPGSGLEAYAALAERDKPAILDEKPLPRCELEQGLSAWFEAITQDLKKAGLDKGKRIFAADLFSGFWLFDKNLRPLKAGSPWYYGDLPGFESADYLLVPQCPVNQKVRRETLGMIAARKDISLTELRRTPLYILLRVNRG